MGIKPPAKPEYCKCKIKPILAQNNLQLDKCYVVGIRGYYKRTMGNPTTNDRGIYDDAIFIVSPTLYKAYNANVDASVYRTGIANLITGVWDYKLGIHGLSKPKSKQYKALVQAGEVTVNRDKQGHDTGWFGINIHKGSYTTTSSLGCQTIYPDQWPEFISTVESEMAKYGQKSIKYILIEF